MNGNALPPNTIYVEAAGPALIASLNYERLLADAFPLRIGVGYFPAKHPFVSVPLTIGFTGIRSGQHELELGTGISVISWYHTPSPHRSWDTDTPERRTTPNGVGFIGYRLRSPEHGGQFRIGFTVIVGKAVHFGAEKEEEIRVLPWGHMSFGWSF